MSIKVLMIHGVGHEESRDDWQGQWTAAVQDGLKSWNPNQTIAAEFLEYDALFDKAKLDTGVTTEALGSLTASTIWHGTLDFLGLSRSRSLPGRARGLTETIRWTAGMVAQWAGDDDLRAKLRNVLTSAVNSLRPDVVCAHSLGSLIAYDTFVTNPGLIAGRRLITFGSQIGHPGVRQAFAGRIRMLDGIAHWYHLFNSEDAAFTARLPLAHPNLKQLNTEFDVPGMLDHDAVMYLSNHETRRVAWRDIAFGGQVPGSAVRGLVRAQKILRAAEVRPVRRALLVGINNYPDPAARLEGCVNDVYRMSEILQESGGFQPEDIRVVLDERATAAGILERLQWLLEGADEKSDRVFFYSGHGARLPTYSAAEKVDHMDECLVPYDFDWSPGTAVTDDRFYELYSQLPYKTRFVAILDCCHSGGMKRGAQPRVRGLNPPDDIHHRSMKWNPAAGMWEMRELPQSGRNLTAKSSKKSEKAEYVGHNGSTRRWGRAGATWTDVNRFEKIRKAQGHKGPYMPLIISACAETELASEYRHGVTSYGAFTYAASTILRKEQAAGRSLTYKQLVTKTKAQLKELGYSQEPTLTGPKVKRNGLIFKP